MSKAEEVFQQLVAELPDGKASKMFGAPCIKAANGKAALMRYKEDLVFKLTGDALKEALALEGAHLFNPMGDRPMGGWVQLSAVHEKKWHTYARISLDYVRTLEK